MSDFRSVAREDDFDPGTMRQYELGAASVIVARGDDGFHAFDARCPHSYQPLIEGAIRGRSITCAYHHVVFSLATGRATFGSSAPLMLYEVRVEDGEVQVGPKRQWSPSRFESRWSNSA